MIPDILPVKRPLVLTVGERWGAAFQCSILVVSTSILLVLVRGVLGVYKETEKLEFSVAQDGWPQKGSEVQRMG